MRLLTTLSLIALLVSSCVTPKVHNELQSSYDTLVHANESMKEASDKATTAHREALSDLKKAASNLDQAIEDSTAMGQRYRKLQRAHSDLNANFEYALANNSQLVQANLRENKSMLEHMEGMATVLSSKEDSLRREQLRLADLELALQSREHRVNELEALVARKDSLAAYFKNRISQALLGFEGRGLTVTLKDGQVHVSMDNRLLFASGQWTVQSEGAKALAELASVLKENSDLNVSVEGHTDGDAFYGRGQVIDNWDLSVMRATSVVKILTSKGMSPAMVQAAGRGEHHPIAANDSTENKAKNRRTDIIITPNYGEIAAILGQ